MFQSIKDFKARYVFTTRYISTCKETLIKLLLNIRIFLSSNKIQLSEKKIV